MPLHSVMLKFAGIGESLLENKLIDLIEVQTDPTIAPYAKEGEVAIRLTTRAASSLEATGKLKPLEEEIKRRVGDHLYATEDITLEEQVLRMLTERGQRLAVAESCTGGQLSDLLTAIPGSSAAFAGGIICYTNEVKHRSLQVPMDVLEGEGAPGAVSEQTARLLAQNVTRITGADFGISVTGVAGPGESEGKPVGLVYIGVAVRDGRTEVVKVQQTGNRETIKLRSAKSALYHLWKTLKIQLPS
ncbi:nicotinamide-nucleotide amidohydrolase family protein [Paenibacillus sp. P26]|nr:nicotinamide-nucleotide amidohydrolase family protein [Paenibacillus sp. P26]